MTVAPGGWTIEHAHVALADPATDATVLRFIGEHFPELHASIAAHPHCDPALQQWTQSVAEILATPAAGGEPLAASEAAAVSGGPAMPFEASPSAASATPRRAPRGLVVTALVTAAVLVVGALGGGGFWAYQAFVAPAATSSAPAEDLASDEDLVAPAATDIDGNDIEGVSVLDMAGLSDDELDRVTTPNVALDGEAVPVIDDPSVPTIVILDASGSMDRTTASGAMRMDEAKAAATMLVTALSGDAEFGLLVFGTGTGNSDAERAAGCSDITTLANLGKPDTAALVNAINGIKHSGFTPLGPAMKQAVSMLGTDGPARIVLVSDGVDTCSPPSACEVAQQLRDQNPQLIIDVAGFDVDSDEQVQAELSCIASVGGGYFGQASNADQLAGLLRQGSGNLTTDTAIGPGGYRDVFLGSPFGEFARTVPGAVVTSETTVDGVVVLVIDCDWGRFVVTDGIVTSIEPKAGTPTITGLVVGDDLARAERLYGSSVDAGTDDSGDWLVFPALGDGPQGYRVYPGPDNVIERIVICLCAPSASAPAAGWNVSHDGVGPIRIGASVEETVELLASRGIVTGSVFGVTEYLSDGSEVSLIEFASGDGVVAFGSVAGDDRIDTIVVTADRQPTSGAGLPVLSGVRLGADIPEVQRVLPAGSHPSLASGASVAAWVDMNASGIKVAAWFDTVPSGGSGNSVLHQFTVSDETVAR